MKNDEWKKIGGEQGEAEMKSSLLFFPFIIRHSSFVIHHSAFIIR